MRKGTMDPEDREHVARSIEFARRAGHMANGLYYDEELAGPGGCDYIIFATEDTTKEDLDKAEALIRSDQDVVGMYVLYVPKEMVAPDERDEVSKSHEEKIKKLRDVKENGFNKVEGVAVDGFSASAILAVYDALNDTNKAKYASLSIPQMAHLAFKWFNEQDKRRQS